MGGKSRISKDIVPIIQSYVDESKGYLEPFVGGANIIDKICCEHKIGSDVNKYLISLLNHAQEFPGEFPDIITYEEYMSVKNDKDRYPDWYVGLVGFCASFGGKFFGGYARDFRGDNSGKISRRTIRRLLEQPLGGISFSACDYGDYSELNGFTIYCDIPYKNTTGYSFKFNHDEFYAWCFKMAKNNIVLVSEYDMPDGFINIWSGRSFQGIDSNKGSGVELKTIEKLFLCGG